MIEYNAGKVRRLYMSNVIAFLNSFLSYLLLMAIIVVIAGVAIFIGIKTRKSKDAKAANTEKATE